jgi:hypothetical protein
MLIRLVLHLRAYPAASSQVCAISVGRSRKLLIHVDRLQRHALLRVVERLFDRKHQSAISPILGVVITKPEISTTQ